MRICYVKLYIELAFCCHDPYGSAYMPTFPIYEGFSRLEIVKKTNPDILFWIAKIQLNPDFLKASPI
jgi:hypothetical protein